MDRPAAPEFSLTAIASGREVNRAWMAGRPLLLLFHDQEGEEMVRSVQGAVRGRWPMVADVVVASVVNMASIPFFVRGLATTVMERAYRQGAAQLPAGLNPADYVIILPDPKGALYAAFGVEGSGRPPVAVVIGPDWRLEGRFRGSELVVESVATLARLRGESPV
ncbi:MAG: hypothetical protein ACRC1H_07385 [Caldilineaceae bacterium]